MQKLPIVALDFASKNEVEHFLELFNEEKLYTKIGMELFYQEGPRIVESVIASGHEVFLDLKLHDIPQTVYQAMKGLGKLGVSMTNLHAAGGKEMMSAGLEGLKEGAVISGKKAPHLIAVTQLTSMTEKRMQEDLLVAVSLENTVLHYAKNAFESGLDGVVCSSLEATMLQEVLGNEFKKVTPGIRLKGDSKNDQKRIVTPAEARQLGATEIVVGRSITRADDPVKAYQLVLQQWQGVEME
ncbi:orotidine-5'-phosphate decarboxylase [Sutcliffiella rhizosphaerae]|uniref:Orotidine 5'-phosphate decarboxylase n=1 Tax=Sutcliffiella rhizosphaerae TaxID=2880967 RepID=A0ABM8YIS4_9BACI|nr:orotidine-5'-phosphate decarboxylase [Sutcliffiella rhizosphaerae]CAG9619774.1 Orotidine 5'-phosphate decarboxylase [Sutcliffiella rhizosphaerae]